MPLKWVNFVTDEQPAGVTPIDWALVDKWRVVIQDRLRYFGADDSTTWLVHPLHGQTFVASVPIGAGDRLAVWWALENDEVGRVLAVRMSEPDPDFEEPPDL